MVIQADVVHETHDFPCFALKPRAVFVQSECEQYVPGYVNSFSVNGFLGVFPGVDNAHEFVSLFVFHALPFYFVQVLIHFELNVAVKVRKVLSRLGQAQELRSLRTFNLRLLHRMGFLSVMLEDVLG